MREASDSAESRNPCSLIRMANLYANICQVGQSDDTIEQRRANEASIRREPRDMRPAPRPGGFEDVA